jgi:hypothetical protein
MIAALGASPPAGWTTNPLLADPQGLALTAELTDEGFDTGLLNMIINSPGVTVQDLQDLYDKKIDGPTLLSERGNIMPAASAYTAAAYDAASAGQQMTMDATFAAAQLAANLPVQDSVTLQQARKSWATTPESIGATSQVAGEIATAVMRARGSFSDAIAAVTAGPSDPHVAALLAAAGSAQELAVPGLQAAAAASAQASGSTSGATPFSIASWFSGTTTILGYPVPNLLLAGAVGVVAISLLQRGGRKR